MGSFKEVVDACFTRSAPPNPQGINNEVDSVREGTSFLS